MKRLPFLMALLFVFAFTIVAQTTGTLNGTISDQGGALVPGATVTLTNTATGASRSTTTNSSGFFSFDALQPGDYTIRLIA